MKQNKIDNALVEEYNKTRNTFDDSLICHAPFNNMYFNSKGNPAACWLSFFYDQESAYPSKSIHDIWFGQEFSKLRDCLRNNDLDYKCEVCKTNLLNYNYVNVLAKAYDTIPHPTKYPSVMELELGNTCNLECIMCFGDLSSSIRQNREHKPPLESPYDKDFVKQLDEFIPHLQEIRFNGGEVFLLDIYYDIWERIIELKPDIKIVLATNGTILTDKIKALLAKGNFHINISIDSLQKETYEYIRKNAIFEKTMENLRYFHKFCQDNARTLCIVTNPMRINWREMPDFINFANNLNVPIWFNTITRPKELGLWSLDYKSLDEVYTILSQVDFLVEDYEWQKKHNINIYNNLVGQQIKNWRDEAKKKI